MLSTPITVVGSERSNYSCDVRLPSIVVEKHTKMSNHAHSATFALAGQMENCVGLLKGHCATLNHCNQIVEGALLSLGVSTTHSLLSSINGVVEGLETVAETCRAMCDSYFEEVRQREDVFGLLSNMHIALKERSETTERELRSLVAERDLKNAVFNKVVAYVETVVAERAAWQEKNGYNCVGLPLVDKSFSEMCREALDIFDNISTQLHGQDETGANYMVSCTDTPTGLVRRWEALQNVRHNTVVPSARLQYVPPRDEVQLLREVLEMGTVSRVLLMDVQEERKSFEEEKKRICRQAFKSFDALRHARKEMESFKVWLIGSEKTGQSFSGYLAMLRGVLFDFEKKIMQKYVENDDKECHA